MMYVSLIYMGLAAAELIVLTVCWGKERICTHKKLK